MCRVEEGMTGLVDFDGDVLPRLFVHTLDLLDLLQGDPVILSTIEGQHRNIDLCHFFWRGVIAATIEWDKCAEVWVASCDGIGQESSHAEAHEPQFLRFNIRHGLDGIQCSDDLFDGAVNIGSYHHHHALSIIRLSGNLAMVEVRYSDDKALFCQLLCQVHNMRLYTPPLLDDYETRMLCIIVGLRYIGISTITIYW